MSIKRYKPEHADRDQAVAGGIQHEAASHGAGLSLASAIRTRAARPGDAHRGVGDVAGWGILSGGGSMSFRLAIPRRVALPQSPPALRQPGRILRQAGFAVQSKVSERQKEA
jgi:hypothetical protein